MSYLYRIAGSFILVATLILATTRPSDAQQCEHVYCWLTLGGPQSGEVTAVAVGPEGTILVGTAGKGLFYRSLSDASWTRSSSSAFDGITIRSIVSIENRFVASTSGKGVWRSLDGGQNWSGLNSGLGSPIVHTLMVASDGHLYAGASTGIYVLGNNDQWSVLGGGAEGHDVRTIAENSEGVLFAGSYGRGILRSKELGVTWELVGSGLTSTIVRTLVVNDNDEIFAGTFGGSVVQRSNDGGDTWVDSGEGLAAQGIWSLWIAPDGTYYAGARSEGIFVSSNGRNWESRPSPYTTVSGFAFSLGSVLAATKVGLLELTGDANWSLKGIPYSRVNAMLFVGSRLLAGLHLGGVHYSDNATNAWTPSTLNNEAILAFASDNAGNILAGTLGSGIFRSSDQGESWDQIWKTIRVVNQIDVDRNDGILAATDNGVYRLAAGDSVWRQLTPPGIATRSAIETQEGILIAGSQRESIWRSADGGETWSQTAPQLIGDETWIWDLVETPSGMIAAATISEGIWTSEDAGVTWEPLPGTSEEAIADLVVEGSGDLVAVSFYGQVFYVEAGSGIAETLGPPFLAAPVRSLAVDTNARPFIGTDPLGVLGLFINIIPAVDNELPGASSERLMVYPNPVTQAANLQLSAVSRNGLQWTVYDILGRAITSGTRDAPLIGETNIDLDTSQLSPGLYLISVQADERVMTGTFVVTR